MIYSLVINSLVNILSQGGYTNQEISKIIRKENLQDSDKALYTMLTYGVVENKLLLDYYLKPLLKSTRVKPFAKNALRVGVYAMEYTTMAKHYVVNEIVECVKKEDYHAHRFVNAVLRNYIKSEKRNLDIPDKIKYLSIKYSINEEIVRYLSKEYPDIEDIIKRITSPSKLNSYVKNPLIKSENEYQVNEDGLIISDKSLVDTIDFKNGVLLAQNPSSFKVAKVLNPEKGDHILDACGAPGSKSVDMAFMMGNIGSITTCDIYEHKIKLIIDNKEKYHTTIIKPLLADSRNFDFQTTFDKILVDAPCSGLGVASHKPDLKYSISVAKIVELADLGYEILDHTSRFLKPGGILVYSTCTITKKENSDNIDKFLQNHQEFKKIEEYKMIPNNLDMPQDGFYICKMRKDK